MEDKQTAVEWLAEKYNYITWMRNRDEMSPETADKLRQDYLEQAKKMEKEQTEISDEEIEESSKQFDSFTSRLFFQLGAQWYREQLKREYNTEMPNNVPYRVQNEAN